MGREGPIYSSRTGAGVETEDVDECVFVLGDGGAVGRGGGGWGGSAGTEFVILC